MRVVKPAHVRLSIFFLVVSVFAAAAIAQPLGDGNYPTTEFAEGANSASVSVGPLAAEITLVRRPDLDPDFDTPVLTVRIDGRLALEVPGVASGFDFPASEAVIVEVDPGNDALEVVFSSYTGGAHCCTQVIVAASLGDRWVAVPIGEFDGDGGVLSDLDGDGNAEIAPFDNRFLYEFDCYACSAAPLVVIAVRDGKAIDVSGQPRFVAAHREWLGQLEQSVDPSRRWSSPGYLAGWVAAKIRVGEGAEAWAALRSNWDLASDTGEEVCLTGEDIEECPRRQRVVLTFPERLELFLKRTGYIQ
ncbi:MAG: hypothetical protein GY798_00445 [Hyphomicrobiales bacterium]|nr:hypothetical protein [Hyphomicrobiales bacterium]